MIVLLMMFLMHIIEDFHMQGILADMKQKSWWNRQIESIELPVSTKLDKYRKDYIMALAVHGFEWAMFMHIPIIAVHILNGAFDIHDTFWIAITASVIINASVHAIIDDMKANRMRLNLVQDQICHTMQIIITYIIFAFEIGIGV